MSCWSFTDLHKINSTIPLTDAPFLCGHPGCRTVTYTTFCGKHFPVKRVYDTYEEMKLSFLKYDLIIRFSRQEYNIAMFWVCELYDLLVLNWHLIQFDRQLVLDLQRNFIEFATDIGKWFFDRYVFLVMPYMPYEFPPPEIHYFFG